MIAVIEGNNSWPEMKYGRQKMRSNPLLRVVQECNF